MLFLIFFYFCLISATNSGVFGRERFLWITDKFFLITSRIGEDSTASSASVDSAILFLGVSCSRKSYRGDMGSVIGSGKELEGEELMVNGLLLVCR